MTIRFDEAWFEALRLAEQVSAAGTDVVLVRDLVGRLSLVVDGAADDTYREQLARRLAEAAGPFASAAPVLVLQDMFDKRAVLDSPDLIIRQERSATAGRGRLAILERGAVGANWVRANDRVSPDGSSYRVTLYGFKGGVGRSTAAFMLARHLASAGHCVLLVDLDLESPGANAFLHHAADPPDYGFVDYMVEAAVNNEAGLDLVSRYDLTDVSGNGELWIAPAAGRPRSGYDYLAKLNRVYTDAPGGPGGRSGRFNARLADGVTACESRVQSLSRRPDLVLLDSRGGIHDIAAVAITQLADLSLLFAADTAQTWVGYRALFGQWRDRLPEGRRDRIRRSLQMVAAMVPPADSAQYLRSFRDHAQECFAETLYDAAYAADLSAYNFSPDDVDAPHYPFPIYFHSDLVGLDPAEREDWHSQPFVAAAYEEYLTAASQLVLTGRP